MEKTKEIDIHKHDRRLETSLELLKGRVSKQNQKLILKFKDDCIRKDLGLPRIVKYVTTLRLIALKTKKDFKKLTKKDIEKFILALQQKDYSEWTKHDYKVVLKRFFKWLKGKSEDYPKEVKWIKTSMKRNKIKLPSEGDLLTEEEVLKLLNGTESLRNKAFIMVLYESGCRIGEILKLKIKNLEFDEHGFKISVSGKTGSRKIRLIASTPYINEWLKHHPFSEDREAQLWIRLSKDENGELTEEMVSYQAIRKMLRKAFARVGIKKRFNPHMFRHSRATYMAKHLTEFQMNYYFGWIQGSGVASTYVHLSGKDLDDAVLEINGIKQEKQDKPENKINPIQCPRCKKLNAHDEKFCTNCYAVLKIETAIKIDEKRQKTDDVMNKLMQDEEVKRFLAEKIKNIF